MQNTYMQNAHMQNTYVQNAYERNTYVHTYTQVPIQTGSMNFLNFLQNKSLVQVADQVFRHYFVRTLFFAVYVTLVVLCLQRVQPTILLISLLIVTLHFMQCDEVRMWDRQFRDSSAETQSPPQAADSNAKNAVRRQGFSQSLADNPSWRLHVRQMDQRMQDAFLVSGNYNGPVNGNGSVNGPVKKRMYIPFLASQ
jgi:hypothetical protein